MMSIVMGQRRSRSSAAPRASVEASAESPNSASSILRSAASAALALTIERERAAEVPSSRSRSSTCAV
eukprot:scaffold5907_cov120-Isochrysis_galbana.AAC.5